MSYDAKDWRDPDFRAEQDRIASSITQRSRALLSAGLSAKLATGPWILAERASDHAGRIARRSAHISRMSTRPPRKPFYYSTLA